MLRNALVWALRSPVRLSVLAVALLVVGLGLIAVVHHGDPSSGAAGRVVAVESSPSPRIEANPEGTEVPPAPRLPRAAARRFLHFYLGPHDSKSRIDSTARRWATPQLWGGLRLADPRLLPTESLSDLKARAVGAFEADFVARLQDDSTLILSVVRGTKGWMVSDIEPGRPTP